MGFFSNLTQIYYNDTLCNGINYFRKEIIQECFTESIQCCNNFIGKELTYNKCLNGSMNLCTVSNKSLEELGYVFQLFGVLCLTCLGTLVVYAFCRFVCYRDVENFENDVQEIQRKRLIQGGYYNSL